MQKGIPPKIVRMWAAQVPALAAIRKEMETMLSFKLIVTLAVVVFMTISLVIHKVPYGITGMTCVVILAFAGALDAKSAFSGFSNTTVILVATMMVIAGALGKTSVVSRVRKLIGKAQGKKGIVLILILSVITIVLTQLMGMTAVMAILLTFVQTLDPDGELCPSRMLFLLACVLCTWFGRFPVGMGAALPLATNAYYEGLVEGHPEYLLGVFDFFKVGIVPSIVLTIYCLLGWKLIPKGQLDASALNMPTGGQKEAEPMSGKKEAVVIGVFLATMVGFFLSSQLGGLIYIIPVAGILLFYYFGVMTVPELVNGLTGDMIWMVASMMAVTNAMSASGADRPDGAQDPGRQPQRDHGRDRVYPGQRPDDHLYVQQRHHCHPDPDRGQHRSGRRDEPPRHCNAGQHGLLPGRGIPHRLRRFHDRLWRGRLQPRKAAEIHHPVSDPGHGFADHQRKHLLPGIRLKHRKRERNDHGIDT